MLDHGDRHHSITWQSKPFVSDGAVASTNHVVARSSQDYLDTVDLGLMLWGQHVALELLSIVLVWMERRQMMMKVHRISEGGARVQILIACLTPLSN